MAAFTVEVFEFFARALLLIVSMVIYMGIVWFLFFSVGMLATKLVAWFK